MKLITNKLGSFLETSKMKLNSILCTLNLNFLNEGRYSVKAVLKTVLQQTRLDSNIE